MKRTIITLIGLLALTSSIFAQGTNIVAGGLPATPPQFPTNQIQQVAGASAVASFALNLLPGWDQTASNSFPHSSLELEVSPAWKSASASGSTPYLSVGASYFFTDLFGVGGDAITFGNGAGASTMDSIHLFGLARKDKGNVAGHLLLGVGRNSKMGRYDGEIGGGLEYRYSTGIGVLVDTRYLVYGTKQTDGNEFLTRVGITLHF